MFGAGQQPYQQKGWPRIKNTRDVLHGLRLEHYLTVEVREQLSATTLITSFEALSESIFFRRRSRGIELKTISKENVQREQLNPDKIGPSRSSTGFRHGPKH